MARITVNPGHGPKNDGGLDPGAVGGKGLYEAVQNLEVAKLVVPKLEYNGHIVQMVHDGDLSDVVRATDSFPTDYFISIHANAHANPWATGVEAWALQPGGLGEQMAIAISEELAAATGLNNRGVKFGGLHVLKCKAPSVLVEAGFISNPDNEEWMRDPAYDEIVAEAICKGFSRAVGISYVSKKDGNKTIAVWYYGEEDRASAKKIAEKVSGQFYPRTRYDRSKYNINIIVGGPEVKETNHINLTGANWIETTTEVIQFLESGRPLEEWLEA